MAALSGVLEEGRVALKPSRLKKRRIRPGYYYSILLAFLSWIIVKKSVCKDTQSRFASVNFECVLGLGSPHQAQHIRQCSCFSEDPEVMHEARVSALEGPCDSSKSHSKENNIFPSERSLICSPSK